jgi:hypothetical protein
MKAVVRSAAVAAPPATVIVRRDMVMYSSEK